jgi:hypothetical protein
MLARWFERLGGRGLMHAENAIDYVTHFKHAM